MEIINFIQEHQETKLYNDLQKKLQKSEWNRRYYLKNREIIIRKNIEHNKLYHKYNENNNLYNRVKYYFKKGYLNGINKNEAMEITKYLIDNHLSIKYINYVREWFELININHRL